MDFKLAANTKQVIVLRTDLNMRKGKMVAQGAHASMSFLTRNIKDFHITAFPQVLMIDKMRVPEVKDWLENSFTKICVGVDSLEQLLDIHTSACEAGLRSYLITDNGTTEFSGVPTKTCCAIGPNYSDEIDKITGGLKLL